MSQHEIPYKIYLQESEMPTRWYNLRADMKNKPAPLLNPATLQPCKPEELEAVAQLKRAKYDTWEWTYGRSPRYTMSNKRRWDAGTLEVCLSVEQGHITDLVFYGDFLAVCPLTDVTDALKGAPFTREAVAAVLERFPLQERFGGITEEEILETLFF